MQTLYKISKSIHIKTEINCLFVIDKVTKVSYSCGFRKFPCYKNFGGIYCKFMQIWLHSFLYYGIMILPRKMHKKRTSESVAKQISDALFR